MGRAHELKSGAEGPFLPKDLPPGCLGRLRPAAAGTGHLPITKNPPRSPAQEGSSVWEPMPLTHARGTNQTNHSASKGNVFCGSCTSGASPTAVPWCGNAAPQPAGSGQGPPRCRRIKHPDMASSGSHCAAPLPWQPVLSDAHANCHSGVRPSSFSGDFPRESRAAGPGPGAAGPARGVGPRTPKFSRWQRPTALRRDRGTAGGTPLKLRKCKDILPPGHLFSEEIVRNLSG